MRFDDVTLQDDDDELRVPFHPQLTMLSGLGAVERHDLANGILASLTGGGEITTLHYVDGTGRPVVLNGRDGQVRGQHEDDGSPAPEPIGSVAPDANALRRLMLVAAEDLGGIVRRCREDESPELREARDMLEELASELEAAVGREQAVADVQSRLDVLDGELRAARDGVARREYAQVLAQLERVRAEAAALQTGTAGIEADRHLLASADTARALARRWDEVASRVAELRAALPPGPRLDPTELARLAQVPSQPPEDLDALVAALVAAADERDSLDQRLQALAVSSLPAPSDPLVAQLGLLDQPALGHAAERLTAAVEAIHRVQVSLGGLEVEEMGPAPSLIDDIETAHAEVEAADQAAEASREQGLVGAGVGVTLGLLLGMAASPLLLPVGVISGGAAAWAGIVRPRARCIIARRAEAEALERAEATSYLGFHIRRVEASVDPKLRDMVDATTDEHRGALSAWLELTGTSTDVGAECALATEIRAYHDAVQNLGDTAVELEQLRVELADRAEPAVAAARRDVLDACARYLITDDQLDDPRMLRSIVLRQCERGDQARAEARIDDAVGDEQTAAGRLEDLLRQLGFDAGELDARVGALEWAVTRAEERERARDRARPRAEIDAELAELQEAAARLRRPEWSTVTAADASTPDIPELEARRDDLLLQLAQANAEVDLERLADRHAAVQRRVAALESRGEDAGGDPTAITEVHQQLVARLTVAAQAGPHGDPMPVVLDEVLQRVPADRTWDLLDILLRMAEHQQVIYLTDDAFVAAWARQRALDGTIMLLEPVPETV